MSRRPDPLRRAAAPARRRAGHRSPARQRGIAMILVLWLTILLTAIGSTFAFGMRHEALAARNAVSLAAVRTAADGAVERAVFEMARPRLPDSWLANGMPHSYQDGEVAVSVVVVDETAKIDLNTAPDALLTSLFTNVGGMDQAAAQALVDAIADWRDNDDLKRPNGAEAPDYQAAGLKYTPSNAPFETVAEAARVLGMPSAVFAKVAPSLTVFSRARGINPATASRDVLLALPNATAETVDAFIAARADALKANLPVPPFPAASGFGASTMTAWHVYATASGADGVTFVREAVVRPSSDMRRPLVVMAWTQGAQASTAAAPIAAQDAQGGNAVENASGRS